MHFLKLLSRRTPGCGCIREKHNCGTESVRTVADGSEQSGQRTRRPAGFRGVAPHINGAWRCLGTFAASDFVGQDSTCRRHPDGLVAPGPFGGKGQSHWLVGRPLVAEQFFNIHEIGLGRCLCSVLHRGAGRRPRSCIHAVGLGRSRFEVSTLRRRVCLLFMFHGLVFHHPQAPSSGGQPFGGRMVDDTVLVSGSGDRQELHGQHIGVRLSARDCRAWLEARRKFFCGGKFRETLFSSLSDQEQVLIRSGQSWLLSTGVSDKTFMGYPTFGTQGFSWVPIFLGIQIPFFKAQIWQNFVLFFFRIVFFKKNYLWNAERDVNFF